MFSPDEKILLNVRDTLGKYPKEVLKVIGVLPKGSTFTGADVVVDSEGYAYQMYASVRGKADKGLVIVVVRPDSFVGAIVGGVDGLKRYLDIVFG